ncbi:MAG: hypothetical protein V1779_13315 [bacterium]
MKNLFYLIFAIFIAYSNLKSGPSEDAIILALRHQTDINLDYQLAFKLDSMLQSSVSLDTSLQNIHADQTYVWNELIVRPTSDADWVTNTKPTACISI